MVAKPGYFYEAKIGNKYRKFEIVPEFPNLLIQINKILKLTFSYNSYLIITFLLLTTLPEIDKNWKNIIIVCPLQGRWFYLMKTLMPLQMPNNCKVERTLFIQEERI